MKAVKLKAQQEMLYILPITAREAWIRVIFLCSARLPFKNRSKLGCIRGFLHFVSGKENLGTLFRLYNKEKLKKKNYLVASISIKRSEL